MMFPYASHRHMPGSDPRIFAPLSHTARFIRSSEKSPMRCIFLSKEGALDGRSGIRDDSF